MKKKLRIYWASWNTNIHQPPRNASTIAWRNWNDTLRLSDIKDYLLHLKYARAIDHEKEVQEFLEVQDKCSKDTFAILHDRHAAAQAIAAPAQIVAAAARTAPKPSTSELKP